MRQAIRGKGVVLWWLRVCVFLSPDIQGDGERGWKEEGLGRGGRKRERVGWRKESRQRADGGTTRGELGAGGVCGAVAVFFKVVTPSDREDGSLKKRGEGGGRAFRGERPEDAGG